ncbi:Na/Pi cotransporter family protein [Reichenbachiella agarivorans]|uniref:Na/Pi cotransporter family protein n=1 Tax=Reichenbachiella agarivorans TaxID=2979464 RepID=A0ABY6CK94_9BACT|nr:Na/Pi cotransporter family protein [Reichenbachiella agarivorans]UXP30933.1 Na/Pi cotransporter family protein [Reichenbachiella agarivorans]
MEYGLFDVLKLVGALGFFIYGMKVMSESIQKVAGDKLRGVMSLITSNRVSGVFTGFLTTAIIQSSSATTVMVVSFVNAGLLKLRQAISVIMGANIGTTITAILILFLGFSKFSISNYALVIIGFGFPLMFAKKANLKYWGEFMIGFALLFMGLDELKHSVPDLKNNPEILAWISSLNEWGFLAIVTAVLIGTVLTVVVQSSSAAMAITLIMCDNGWIPFDMAAAIVLGENIGTTITANLAALVGNVHAKRAARAHLVFNLLGVVWMLLVFHFYINTIDSMMVALSDHGSPLNDTSAVKWGLTYFHISFNIINTLIMIWFVPYIEKLVIKMVPSRDEEDDEFRLEFIGTSLMSTTEIALLEARKELALFGEMIRKMHDFSVELVNSDNPKRIEKLLKKIEKYEQHTDELEVEIDDYLVKVAEGRLSSESSEEIRAMLSITSDLERVADIMMRMSKDASKKTKYKFDFNKEQTKNLNALVGLVGQAIDQVVINLNKSYSDVTPDNAKDIERQINAKTKELNKDYFKKIKEKDFDIRTGVAYRDWIFACEKIGDHLINVTESLSELNED